MPTLIAECKEADPVVLESLQILDALEAARKLCAPVDPPLMDYDEDDEATTTTIMVDDAPEQNESPVAPMQGNRVKQLKFEYEMKNVLAARNKGDCKKLKKAFRDADYKRENEVYPKQVDKMLDVLEDSQKKELFEIFREIYAKVGKDPDADPLTFKDWTLFKLGLKEATICQLEYARKK